MSIGLLAAALLARRRWGITAFTIPVCAIYPWGSLCEGLRVDFGGTRAEQRHVGRPLRVAASSATTLARSVIHDHLDIGLFIFRFVSASVMLFVIDSLSFVGSIHFGKYEVIQAVSMMCRAEDRSRASLLSTWSGRTRQRSPHV